MIKQKQLLFWLFFNLFTFSSSVLKIANIEYVYLSDRVKNTEVFKFLSVKKLKLKMFVPIHFYSCLALA